MLFDVIVDNYDNIIPGSGQVSFYSGKIYKHSLVLSTVACLQIPHGWYHVHLGQETLHVPVVLTSVTLMHLTLPL